MHLQFILVIQRRETGVIGYGVVLRHNLLGTGSGNWCESHLAALEAHLQVSAILLLAILFKLMHELLMIVVQQ